MKKIDEVYEALSKIIDPEIGFDIVSLGLIYDVTVTNSSVEIKMTLSTKSCPLHDMILSWVQTAALGVDGIEKCDIDLVWEPAWNVDMINHEVRKKLKD